VPDVASSRTASSAASEVSTRRHCEIASARLLWRFFADDFRGKVQNLGYGSTRIETDQYESLGVVKDLPCAIAQYMIDLRRSTNL
jgi:hypothetical protein